MGDRVSNRELRDKEEKEKMKEIGLGDLVADMIAIGDPTDVYTKRQAGLVKKAKFMKEELNRRDSTRKARKTKKSTAAE